MLGFMSKETFNMTVDPPTLAFDGVDPDPTEIVSSGYRDLFLDCETNDNKLWKLNIWVTSPLTCGIYTIPNENFKWNIPYTNGGGTPDVGNGYLVTRPQTFYNSTVSEGITSSPVEFTLRFYVDVPPNQVVGTYETTLILKMSDVTATKSVEITRDVSIVINPKFSLSVSPASLNFGSVDPGTTTGPLDFFITCATNNNMPWHVTMNVLSELTSGQYTIPNENFHWYNAQTGYGFGTMSITPFTIYEASQDEYVTSQPIQLHMQFNISVPQYQHVGQYTSTLVVTMTE